MNVWVIWVLDYFLCSSYRCIIYTHSRSNLCHSNVSSTYYVSKKYLNNQIQQNYPAPVGFLTEPDFCRICKKCQIPAGAGAEIRYSPKNDKTEQKKINTLQFTTSASTIVH